MCKKIAIPGPSGANYSESISVTEVKRTVTVAGRLPITAKGFMGRGILLQTMIVLDNIKESLKKQKMEMSDIIETTCYLKSEVDLKEFDETYGKYLRGNGVSVLPTRATVVAGIPIKNVLIEIKCTAVE